MKDQGHSLNHNILYFQTYWPISDGWSFLELVSNQLTESFLIGWSYCLIGPGTRSFWTTGHSDHAHTRGDWRFAHLGFYWIPTYRLVSVYRPVRAVDQFNHWLNSSWHRPPTITVLSSYWLNHNHLDSTICITSFWLTDSVSFIKLFYSTVWLGLSLMFCFLIGWIIYTLLPYLLGRFFSLFWLAKPCTVY